MKTRKIVLIVSGFIALASWGWLSLEAKQKSLASLIVNDLKEHPHSWRQCIDTSEFSLLSSEADTAVYSKHVITSVMSVMGDGSYHNVKIYRNDSLNLTVEINSYSTYYADFGTATLTSPLVVGFNDSDRHLLERSFNDAKLFKILTAGETKKDETVPLQSKVAKDVFHVNI